jgi:hypothetical protein
MMFLGAFVYVVLSSIVNDMASLLTGGVNLMPRYE